MYHYLSNKEFEADLSEPGEECRVARPHETRDVSQQAETETDKQ
jgi:hypothetical protein